jgi:hypothetical protein
MVAERRRRWSSAADGGRAPPSSPQQHDITPLAGSAEGSRAQRALLMVVERRRWRPAAADQPTAVSNYTATRLRRTHLGTRQHHQVPASMMPNKAQCLPTGGGAFSLRPNQYPLVLDFLEGASGHFKLGQTRRSTVPTLQRDSMSELLLPPAGMPWPRPGLGGIRPDAHAPGPEQSR